MNFEGSDYLDIRDRRALNDILLRKLGKTE